MIVKKRSASRGGPVGKASARKAEEPGFESQSRRDGFSRVSQKYLQIFINKSYLATVTNKYSHIPLSYPSAVAQRNTVLHVVPCSPSPRCSTILSLLNLELLDVQKYSTTNY